MPRTARRYSMNRNKLKLLISIRDVAEAGIVREFENISIVDLKEPLAGSLGCVDFETACHIAQLMPPTQSTSIALGEAIDGLPWPPVPPKDRGELLSKFRYAKFGLAGLARFSDWVANWKIAFEAVPKTVQRVAVGYADAEEAAAPRLESIVEAAAEVGCQVLLLDTFRKQHGNLLDHVKIPRLKSLIATASDQGLSVGLAGSLDVKSLDVVRSLRADFLAVRGAVCSGDRTASVDRIRIAELLDRLNR